MSAPRIGSLCTGYGGLDMAVEAVTGGELAWVSDIDKGACKVLAHRFPDVPNIGDMTRVDWSQVEPVDVLEGGTPCQDLSHAGKRAGMTEGTRSNLWVVMREAIAVMRPKLVIWENVGGAYSAEADSELERSEGLLGGGAGRPALRALGRVLGDLASLGFDAEWHGIRAADVGAPHGRLRVFLVAYPREVGRLGRQGGDRTGWHATERSEARDHAGDRRSALLPTPTTRDHKGRNQRDDATCLTGAPLPTPRATDGTKGGPNQRGSSGDLMLASAVTLLPTPAVNDMGEGKTVDAWDEWIDRMQAAHGNGNGHGKSLAIEAQRLLPTPTTTQRGEDVQARDGRPGAGPNLHNEVIPERWGDYAAAIARWEALARPAPSPTQPSKRGTPQLSPAFAEWMMGLPAGWITDVPGVTRNEALKLAGNGVVPQQAEAALRIMLARCEVAA